MDYKDFLKSKIAIAKNYGYQDADLTLPEILLPHQKDIVKWAIEGGRRAIFATFGMGKTLIQLTLADYFAKKEKGKSLIICPLGIKQEFYNDAKNLLDLNIDYVKTTDEIIKNKNKILITNYERVRDGQIDIASLIKEKEIIYCTLDEASVLRGYGTKTYQEFLILFKGLKFKNVCTATPSPNKFKELIHYVGFLEIMDTGEALTRFFKRDSTKANKLTIYPHKEKEFWYWVSSWSIFASKPSDINKTYSDQGYDLPELKIIEHELPVDHLSAGIDRDGQVKMFRDAAISLRDASAEKRDSLNKRIEKMKHIINADKNSHFVIWHHLEDERKAIKKAIPEAVEVYGSLDIDTREKRILDFSYGKEKYIATKPSISGSGCNFQRFCNKQIFLGIDYSFNDFIQAIHRSYRYLQKKDVEIHVIFTESEREIIKTLYRKWADHNKLVQNMINIIKEHGINNNISTKKLLRTMGIERKELKSELFTISNNDCVLECKNIESNTIGMVLTSIPFSNHYEYTPSYNDFGHTKNNNHFWEQMDYLTPELERILIPGRIAAIHVKDRILFSSMTEYSFPTVSPFHAETIFHFQKHGFGFLGMITIETDVVRENNQTYRLGWSEQCKDGSKMGIGSPEYLLLFRKQPTNKEAGYSDIPVMKDKSIYTRGMWQIDARAKWNSSGDRFLTPEEMSNMSIDKISIYFMDYFKSRVYDYEKHVKTANDLDKIGRLPATFEMLKLKSRNWYLWDDVNRMITLNLQQSKRKQTNHICPLQFDIVDRAINRFSNINDIIFDPFGGLMTVPYRAVKLKRKGYASELNPEYYRDGCAYMRAIEIEVKMPSLFDFENAI